MALPHQIENNDPADADAVMENFDWLYDRLTGAVTGAIPYASLDLDGSVDSDDLEPNSVGTSEIQDDAVTLAKLPRNTITTDSASSTGLATTGFQSIGCSVSLTAGRYLVMHKLVANCSGGPVSFDLASRLRIAGVTAEETHYAASIPSGTRVVTIPTQITVIDLDSTQTVDLYADTDSLNVTVTSGSYIKALPIAG